MPFLCVNYFDLELHSIKYTVHTFCVIVGISTAPACGAAAVISGGNSSHGGDAAANLKRMMLFKFIYFMF